MKNRLFLWGIFGILWSIKCDAQFYRISSDDVKDYPLGFRFDLLSHEINPGARLALEYPMRLTTFRNYGNINRRTEHYRHFIFAPSISWSIKPSIHQNFFAETEWLMRRKNERGIFIEYGLGIGANYILSNSPVKPLLSDTLKNGFHVAPSISLGFGSDLFQATDNKRKILWSIRLHVPVLISTDKTYNPIYIIQGGITFYMPNKHLREQRYITKSRTNY